MVHNVEFRLHKSVFLHFFLFLKQINPKWKFKLQINFKYLLSLYKAKNKKKIQKENELRTKNEQEGKVFMRFFAFIDAESQSEENYNSHDI